jgi:hypothetical protein
MKPLVMAPQLAEQVSLLVREIAFDQEFSREIIIPGQLSDVALHAMCSGAGIGILAIAIAHVRSRFLS